MSSNQHTARLPYHQLSSKAFMGLVNLSETLKDVLNNSDP